MLMKLANLVLIILGVLFLNPRIDLQGLKIRPKSIVSCSTGWSIQFGKGLIGIYSLETASKLRSSSFMVEYNNNKNLGKYNSLNYQSAKASIMQPCK